MRWAGRPSTTNSPEALNFVARPRVASVENDFVRSALDRRWVSHFDIVEDVPDLVRQQRRTAMLDIWAIVRCHSPPFPSTS